MFTMNRWLMSLMGLSLVVGCATKHPPKDLVSSGQVKFEPVATSEAELPAPSSQLAGDVIQIDGVVKRKPDYNGPLDGHVKIEFVSATGEVLEQFPIEWEPQDVPTSGDRQAEYALNYGWVPPAGTTVRVSIVEDVDWVNLGGGGDSKGPRTAGRAQNLPSGPRTPRPTGQPKSGRAGGTPGTPRQHSSSPGTPGASRGGRGHR
jgi:hypothetical protein